MTSPQLLWDWGTAYDLFVSLAVLHEPGEFGVRGSWAAGVRARLPADERETLEQAQKIGHVPFHWIYALPEPKDAASALFTLEQIPAAERLPALSIAPDWPPAEVAAFLGEVAARGGRDEGDDEAYRAACRRSPECSEKMAKLSPEHLDAVLDAWAYAEEFGERYLAALTAYWDGFFAEEERRIRLPLQKALARAQELAQNLPLLDLLEELSQGLRFEQPPQAAELVLAPSYWCTPLMFLGKVSDERALRLFGARPPEASLVPGETVPDALLQALKALSDPTRLRILHYLSEEPLSPTELARRLRLRAPTVVHHLKTLRLAGLVQVTLGESKETKRYAPRPEAVKAAFGSLEGFLDRGE